MDIAFLADTLKKLLGALPTTLALLVLSVSIGSALAIGIVWMRASGNFILERFARFYIYVFRGSPLLIQMFLVYYGLSQFPAVRQSMLWPVLRDPFSWRSARPATPPKSFAAASWPCRDARSKRRAPAACPAFCCSVASSLRSPSGTRCHPIRPRSC
jgi:His/Glu/Gln/Arg/opine family amino acid ABC transporter permease subunit